MLNHSAEVKRASSDELWDSVSNKIPGLLHYNKSQTVELMHFIPQCSLCWLTLTNQSFDSGLFCTSDCTLSPDIQDDLCCRTKVVCILIQENRFH